MTDPRREMQLLYDVEYGDWREWVMRMSAVGFGALLMVAYANWTAPIVWALCFYGIHVANYRFTSRRLTHPTQREVWIAGGLFAVLTGVFVPMPVVMVLYGDPVMVYGGALLLATTVAYHIRRGDRILWLNWAQNVIFSCAGLTILVHFLPQVDSPLGKAGAIFATLAAVTYVAMAMLFARRARLALEEAGARLAQDQKMSAIGRLAGGVAHDFNNVLTVVQGNLELYHVMEDKADRDAAVAEAQAAAKRAEAVVQQLLIYARKAPTQRKIVDANAAMSEIMGLIHTLVPERIAVHLIRTPCKSMVEVDAAQLTTAMLNLAKNAMDAMPASGNLHVVLSIEDVTEPRQMIDGRMLRNGPYLAIAVRDTGCGIPADSLSKVAEPFFTTKPAGQGTGLGLSMVIGFVQEQGGGLGIESSTQGTEVTLYLPRIAATETEAAIQHIDTMPLRSTLPAMMDAPTGTPQKQNAARMSGVPMRD